MCPHQNHVSAQNALWASFYRLAAGLRTDPLGELTALPRPLDGFKGRTSKGRGGEEEVRK